VCLLSLAEKKGGRSDGFIYLFFFNIFLFWNSVSLGYTYYRSYNLWYFYIYSVLNTLSTVIDNIIPFGFRKRQNFQDFINFEKFSNKKLQGRGEKIGSVGEIKHKFFLACIDGLRRGRPGFKPHHGHVWCHTLFILNDYVGRICKFLANHNGALIYWNPITTCFVVWIGKYCDRAKFCCSLRRKIGVCNITSISIHVYCSIILADNIISRYENQIPVMCILRYIWIYKETINIKETVETKVFETRVIVITSTRHRM
jgi:hypothetical protein